MKGGLRGKRFPLALVAMICTTLIIWAWERTPLRATFFSSTDQFDMLSPGIIIGTPVSESIYTHQQPSSDEDISDPGTHENPSIYTHQQPSSDVDISDPGTHENPSIENAEQVPSDPPMDSTTLSSLKNITKATDLIMMPTEKIECNYAKGKWVADEKRPLYSGFSCNQWLSKMWACRWMKRKDFSYESFRWQPYQCEMPEFEGSKFLRRMQNKTVALVGDSLGRQQFQSLMCMATEGKESPQVQDVGGEYGLAKSHGALRPDGWAYRFPSTNTTILYYWSASLCELEPLNRSNPSTTIAMHLDRPVWFLKHYLHRFDVLVLNTGHHWNRGKLKANRWEIYVGGAPKILDIASAKNLAVYNVIKWLDSQIPRHPRLKAFFRTMSPRHFANGDWNTGGSCDSVTPLLRGSEVSQEGSSDSVVEGAVKGTKVNILDITALSQLRDEGHISKYSVKTAEGPHDCLHWCLPGIPDTWNELLFAQL